MGCEMILRLDWSLIGWKSLSSCVAVPVMTTTFYAPLSSMTFANLCPMPNLITGSITTYTHGQFSWISLEMFLFLLNCISSWIEEKWVIIPSFNKLSNMLKGSYGAFPYILFWRIGFRNSIFAFEYRNIALKCSPTIKNFSLFN